MTVKQIVLASRPDGAPGLQQFRTEEIELPALKEGEVLLRPLYVSVDPYMRGRMRDVESYIPPFQVDKPLEGGVVAIVEESRFAALKPGDKVSGMLPWATKFIAEGSKLQPIGDVDVPDSYNLGILGTTGYTAYFGVVDILKPQPGQTIVISGAAGAVGVIAGQIAKLHGARIIGIAGSDEKNELLKKEFGFDEVINYNTEDIPAALARTCPDGIDGYLDNVGGDITDAVVARMNMQGKIALIGQIALYNAKEEPKGPRILYPILMKGLLVQGFLIRQHYSRWPEARQAIAKMISEGKLKSKETIVEGFDELPNAFLGLFKGSNIGKMIVKI
ncbi:NADP-dependent oxidoreductase [Pseudoflavitalea sp. G-6-1-2]|uniref:NADP-dependent oxidoreductase n=1 Tax=Pseudoflavitalea sp. G-6-1-2 TaxID=2728841 RepID=UPI00146D84BE|nr:NADP-dependent oxidoreductase [Pseudoflavitalea sp. G-6-1-2]NML21978.1 NADP-dependent oxidoreductase [Pseudoflavitalea sp. G-6-1-2]